MEFFSTSKRTFLDFFKNTYMYLEILVLYSGDFVTLVRKNSFGEIFVHFCNTFVSEYNSFTQRTLKYDSNVS